MHTAINFVGAPASAVSLVKWIESEVALINGDIASFTISRQQFLSALKKDKKNSTTEQCLIVPAEDGKLMEKLYPLTEENLEKCFDALVESLEKLKMSYEIL